MRFALAALFALLSGCAWQAAPRPLLLTFADGTCSGTAIAPHAILTATHCFENGKPRGLHVANRIDDGNDHTLLIVADDTGARAQIAACGAQVLMHRQGQALQPWRRLNCHGCQAVRFSAS